MQAFQEPFRRTKRQKTIDEQLKGKSKDAKGTNSSKASEIKDSTKEKSIDAKVESASQSSPPAEKVVSVPVPSIAQAQMLHNSKSTEELEQPEPGI